MHLSDEVLYRSYLVKRDEDALRTLLERHREGLTLFLCGFVGNMEDAEELMIDAFAVAASGTSRFTGASCFKTWLYGIGRNLARTHLRGRRPSMPLDDAGDAGSPELALLEAERSRQLYQAMERLNPEYRQVLYLLYIEGMGQDEVARIMRKSKKQIYHLTSRGREALRSALERMGFEYETV